MDGRDRRAALIAAWINGLLVALIPLWMALASVLDNSDPPVRPPGVSGVPPLLAVLPLVYVFGALGALAGWRTFVHALAYVQHRSSGWIAVLEPAGLGFAVAIVLLSNGIRTNPGAAPPYVIAYGGGAVVAGLAIGVVLRLIAVATLRISAGGRAHPAPWAGPPNG